MIRKINKNIEIVLDNNSIQLPQKLRDDIKDFWGKIKVNEPHIWDGDDICAIELEELDNKIVILCKNTRYSHYLYDERIGIDDKKYWCSCLWAGILLKTLDNYYVLTEAAEKTSLPHCIQIFGGGPDNTDIIGEHIDIISTIKRELKEEANLDMDNKDDFLHYKIEYLELPQERRHAYGIIAVGNLNMTKEQIKEHHKKYVELLKEKNEEIEVENLVFLDTGKPLEDLNKYSNPIRKYVKELFEVEDD